MSPDFSPISALAGGALIGLAAALLWLGNGRIAGISGIVGGMRTQGPDLAWRIAFIAGLVLAPLGCAVLWRVTPISIDASAPLIMVGGLLVGFGTRLGSGCTSGHGVCGLARLSARSLVATMLFMGAGFATVFLARHLVGG